MPTEKSIREKVKESGGVEKWIVQTPGLAEQIHSLEGEILDRARSGNLRLRIVSDGKRIWPKSLSSLVKPGHKRPSSPAGPIEIPQLSAGMPGNEETDP
jgi:hypothetical protein